MVIPHKLSTERDGVAFKMMRFTFAVALTFLFNPAADSERRTYLHIDGDHQLGRLDAVGSALGGGDGDVERD